MFYRIICLTICAALFSHFVSAQVITPGTGIHFNLESLSTNYPDAIILESEGVYRFNSDFTLSVGDTFSHNAEVQIALLLDPDIFVSWEGFVYINPSELFTITSTESFNRYSGMDFETEPNSEIHNTAFFYGNGIFVRASDPLFSNCTFAQHGHAYRSGALTLSNSNAEIISCSFMHNSRAGIASAANGNASPNIADCTFIANNTSNGNYPQINLGISNQATPEVPIRISIAYIQGLYPMAGGIAVTNLLGSGFSNAVIEDCIIVNNRYGIAQLGGNIHGIFFNNQITDNNIENNPMTGGSGFNFNGNSTNTAIVSSNIISGNLWGVTIQGEAQPSFGNLNEPDNEGMNYFDNNGNAGNLYALYNNTPGTIWAQNNIWSPDQELDPESVIFHQPDDALLGPVIFEPVYTEVNVLNPRHKSSMVLVFPNPTKAGQPLELVFADELLLYADLQVAWYNIQGKLLSTGAVNNNSIPIPAHFNSGLYLLQIKGSHYDEIIRVMVE